MMETRNHAHILHAYLARMTEEQLAKAIIHVQMCAQAGMNGSTGSQVAAHNHTRQFCQAIVESMIPHDRQCIENIIRTEIA